jgi:CHAT domain-containing protein/tetratricopeptide (TPR) repeat protein
MISGPFNSRGCFLLIVFLLSSVSVFAQKKKAKSDGVIKLLWQASHFDIDQAETYYLQEINRLKAERALFKEKKFARIISQPYWSLASVYYKKGDYKKAEKYYSKLDSLTLLFPNASFLRDLAQDERSRLMIEIGDHTEAKRIIQQNIAKFENLSDKRLQSCPAYSTIATYYSTLGQYDSSAYYHKKYILSMHNNWFLPFVNDMANSYTQLADVSLRGGQLQEALKFARRGYRINSHRWARKNNNAYNHYDRIVSANVKAEVYRLTGKTKKALRWNTKAYTLYKAKSAKIAQYELPVLTTRALTYWAMGKIDSAQLNFNQATTTYFNYINDNFSYLSEFERVYFYNHSKHHIEFAKSFYFEQLKNHHPGADQKLYELAVNTKGLLFSSSLKFVDKINTSTDTTVLNQYKKLKAIKNKVSRLSLADRTGTNTEILQTLDQEVKVREKQLMEKLGLEKEKFVTQADILNHVPEHYQLVDIVKCYTIQATQPTSKTQSTILQLSDSSAYVYFVSQGDKLTFQVDYSKQGKRLESSLYTAYRNSVRFDLKEPLLHAAYFKKIESLLTTKDILYSADGIYNLINPNVLFDGQAYLLERFNLNALLSAKELLNPRLNTLQVSSVSFFGRPDFSGHVEENSQPSYTDLPGTEHEIKSIQAIIPASVNHQSYFGSEANETVVKNLTASSIIHFATHGYFNESSFRNPLLNSGIVLSRATDTKNQDATQEDGLLTAYEASTLNLSNTSLVILSACETGLGATVDGDGVWGLQRAFQSAGVNYIIMSLFKVDDAITAQLMTRFYENLVSGQLVFEAFKNAEKSIKATHPQPIHWGSFILKGY